MTAPGSGSRSSWPRRWIGPLCGRRWPLLARCLKSCGEPLDCWRRTTADSLKKTGGSGGVWQRIAVRDVAALGGTCLTAGERRRPHREPGAGPRGRLRCDAPSRALPPLRTPANGPSRCMRAKGACRAAGLSRRPAPPGRAVRGPAPSAGRRGRGQPGANAEGRCRLRPVLRHRPAGPGQRRGRQPPAGDSPAQKPRPAAETVLPVARPACQGRTALMPSGDAKEPAESRCDTGQR